VQDRATRVGEVPHLGIEPSLTGKRQCLVKGGRLRSVGRVIRLVGAGEV
jgi:hypothetical protein